MFFFFQAEDGIRDGRVTGVQTCALPICRPPPYCLSGPKDHNDLETMREERDEPETRDFDDGDCLDGGRVRACREIGRASCRERALMLVPTCPWKWQRLPRPDRFGRSNPR